MATQLAIAHPQASRKFLKFFREIIVPH